MKDHFSNRYILKTLAFLLIMIGVLFFLFPQPWPYVKGAIFGGLISVLMFKLLYLTIKKSVEMESGKAQAYATTQYILRYLIYGVTIFVAAKANYLNLWTTLLGLFSIKYVIWLNNLYEIFREKREEEKNERNHRTSG